MNNFFSQLFNCGKPRPRSSNSRLKATRDEPPEAQPDSVYDLPPEIQSIYEVPSLRHLSVSIDRDPGSWHSDLDVILLQLGKFGDERSLSRYARSTPPSSRRYNLSAATSPRPRFTSYNNMAVPQSSSAAAAEPSPLITGLHHINITIPDNTLGLAKSFYSETLGLTLRPVPAAQVHELVWLDIGNSGQQVHISLPKHKNDTAPLDSSRHPCFKVASPEALLELQKRIYEHFQRGGEDAPLSADAIGETSGPTTKEYPKRFFARDFAGNRLEFTV